MAQPCKVFLVIVVLTIRWEIGHSMFAKVVRVTSGQAGIMAFLVGSYSGCVERGFVFRNAHGVKHRPVIYPI